MSQQDPLLGRTVSTYTITECLSRSEVSNVYLAENQRIMSQVVMRVLPPPSWGTSNSPPDSWTPPGQ